MVPSVKSVFFVIMVLMGMATAFAAVAKTEEELIPHQHTAVLEMQEGDKIASLLSAFDIDRQDSNAVVQELANVLHPAALKGNHKIHITYTPPQEMFASKRLVSLFIPLGDTRVAEVTRVGENYFIAQVTTPQDITLVSVEGTIQSTLFQAASVHHIPLPIIMDFIQLFSYDVDFQRDVQKDDTFKILYEQYMSADKKGISGGNILFATLKVKGEAIKIYQFATGKNEPEYYTGEGRTIKKALLRTPIDGAVITSQYGKRLHPMLGYTRMHKGVDFGAPKGTPVYAAGKGTIEYIGDNGSYGKYIRIFHGPQYQTAYAHLSRYEKGIKQSSQVKQGQIIGYVGSTGRSTGAHLHYEVLDHGQAVNPSTVKGVANSQLAGSMLQAFNRYKDKIEQQFTVLLAQK